MSRTRTIKIAKSKIAHMRIGLVVKYSFHFFHLNFKNILYNYEKLQFLTKVNLTNRKKNILCRG